MCIAGMCCIGLFLVVGTWFKPSFFWNSSQCLKVRHRLGNRGTQAFYYGLGGILLFIVIAYLTGFNSIKELVIFAMIALIFIYFFAKKSNGFSFKSLSLSQGKTVKDKWKCANLRRELHRRVSATTAERLVEHERFKYPNKPESWYLDKVIYDLKRGR